MKRICFIGHRSVLKCNEVREQLVNIIKQAIKKGYRNFTMGTHGEFDKIALNVCREIRKFCSDLKIEIVITSFKAIEPIIDHDIVFGDEKYIPYEDVNTIMYNIEEEHFKRKIIVSNQKMIDTCDTLICYVDTKRSYGGAILAYNYAKKKGLNFYIILSYYKY